MTSDDFCEAFDLSCKITTTVTERALNLGRLVYHDVCSEECIYKTITSRIKVILANTYDQCVVASSVRRRFKHSDILD